MRALAACGWLREQSKLVCPAMGHWRAFAAMGGCDAMHVRCWRSARRGWSSTLGELLFPSCVALRRREIYPALPHEQSARLDYARTWPSSELTALDLSSVSLLARANVNRPGAKAGTRWPLHVNAGRCADCSAMAGSLVQPCEFARPDSSKLRPMATRRK